MMNFTFRHPKTYLTFLFSLVLFSQVTHSKIQNFETTRLKSTAGAGVGSILMDEATVLNPAPIAFFNVGSIYLNKGSSEVTSENQVLSEVDDLGIIVSDSKGDAAGSLSYQKQTSGNLTRTRLAVAMSTPIRKKSAMGVTLRRTTDEVIGGEKEEYLQTIMGVTHVVSESFTIGFVANDPFKKRPEDSMGTFGTQYVYKDFISIMLDVGANYYQELRETFVYKSAVQFKLLEDFYARFGYFRDLGEKESGTGVGLGWVQPRLVLEGALKNTTDFAGAKISETSFSLSYRF